ncbi:X-ray repair cross-complementing protein 6 [Balamuthia mandrillaris]
MWEDPFGEEGNLFDGDEEEELDQEYFHANKDCIIFLVDCQPDMFKKNDREEIPFFNALKCVIATLTDKIISSENDLVGLCFYGTEKKKNANDFEGIYVMQELDTPDAHRIMELETLLRSGTESFGEAYGHRTDFPLCDALWTCSTMFSNCSVKVGHKRIFLFTNEDNPNAENKNLRDQSFQRAKDLAELGIDIELFSMNKATQSFDPSRFYQYIISVSEDEDTGLFNYDASAKFEELRARVRRKEFKKRAINRFSLFIGPDIEIALRLYNLVQKTTKGSHVWLDAKTNQPVKTMSKWVCVDTGTLLMDTQIKYSYGYGGESVIFDKDEVATIKALDKKGLQLMGFKPRHSLKTYYNIRHSSFVYPDEHEIQGSTVAFTALLDRMLHMDKLAIARWIPRDGAPPRFVALLPQQETFDEDGIQINPPGFHLIPLPYADDIRTITLGEPQPKANEEQILKAKKLVKTLRINFDSRSFENPALQKHYASLQALALDRDTVEETPDYLQPDEEGMSRFSAVIDEFKSAVFSEDYESRRATKPGQKRKRVVDSGDTNKRPEKKAAVDEETVQELASLGQLKKLTIPQLKQYLMGKGVAVRSDMRKPVLLDLLTDYLQEAAVEGTSPASGSDGRTAVKKEG